MSPVILASVHPCGETCTSYAAVQAAVNSVIFACVHNAGRSQMAAAFFNEFADPGTVRAGRPAPSRPLRSIPWSSKR
jgi:hypothetical protein